MITTDVLIVGAGSSGLFLANLLIRSGVKVLIVEKKLGPGSQSKAIGIHPPGLQLLNKLNLLSEFESKGVKITSGKAFVGKKQMGTLQFGSENPADYILSIPQHQTEAILRNNIDSSSFYWGHEATDVSQKEGEVKLITKSEQGDQIIFKSKFVIGCDGINSKIRSLIQADWNGKSYEFHYTMGDFPDNTGFGDAAAIYLSPDGLTESFPLPGGNRRWVVNHLDGKINVHELIEKIKTRTGFDLSDSESSMHSNFQVHKFESTKIFDGNIILLGDSSHIMSPIGGQAISLHWKHANSLESIISQKIHHKIDNKLFIQSLEMYSKLVFKNAKIYSARAAFNTRLGLPGKSEILLKFIVLFLTRTPLKKIIAKRFSMRN